MRPQRKLNGLKQIIKLEIITFSLCSPTSEIKCHNKTEYTVNYQQLKEGHQVQSVQFEGRAIIQLLGLACLLVSWQLNLGNYFLAIISWQLSLGIYLLAITLAIISSEKKALGAICTM